MGDIILFIKKEPELVGSFFIAIFSCIFVKPSWLYLNYIDFDVLVMLFCLMLVISGLAKNNLFACFSRFLVSKASHARELCLSLILACFFSAMLVTNDVALLIFVPLSAVILSNARLHGYILVVVVMQTVAANLGSMLTPIGNPQNLFLYSYFKLDFLEFLAITLPVTLVSLVIIIPTVLWVKKKHIVNVLPSKEGINDKFSNFIFTCLFLLCLATVVHILSYSYLLLIVCLVTLVVDRSLFKLVDYKLLLTFFFFFIFCGNLTSLQFVQDVFSLYIKGHEFWVSLIASQFISNVPAAIILAGFTKNYQALILGTNIGGLGTLIASMASLISFRYYKRTTKAKPLLYLTVFSLVNIAMLVILVSFVLLLRFN